MRSASPRPASTRRRSPTCTRARHRQHLRGAATSYDFLARPVQHAAEHRGGDARGLGRLQDLHRPRQAGHLLRRRPGVQGQAARAGRRRLRLLAQAPLRPGWKSPQPVDARERRASSASTSCAGGARRQAAVRLRPRGRGPARARPLHAAVQARPSRARASSTTLDRRRRFIGAVAREVVEAYGDRIMEHPVGTGPFRLATGSAARGSCSSATRLPRGALRRGGARRRPARAGGRGKRCKGRKLPMVDRVEISIIEENQPRWLAFLNGEHRPARAGAGGLHRPSRSRTASSRRNLAKRGI